MHAYPTDLLAPQTTVLGIPGDDALYGCVDWFLYQPPQPGQEIASAESSAPPLPRAELALSY